ncbi:predicted protein [Histoplasma mississippiense (nom. inval.)]|uniref:predicted protein n=1 Tax=Ajellomyces capsulatus (strain NAm1 / WU24) TaxID=2059318 RepID=UPI000157D328|nr:predicted protein [Histoplasma mississippiense (nom. inval.)]EDN04483.1 predicted protein [Histoplasma mississippiense (nom. inval.)]
MGAEIHWDEVYPADWMQTVWRGVGSSIPTSQLPPHGISTSPPPVSSTSRLSGMGVSADCMQGLYLAKQSLSFVS